MAQLDGKTIVITGASAGIGAAGARQLHALGADVMVVGRDPAKTAAVARDTGGRSLTVDMTSLAEVRHLADDLLEQCPRIDVLWNNAGGTFPQRFITTDGYERTFQVNHLAPFLLTSLLRDRLAASGPARVVTTSSAGHALGKINLNDLDSQRGHYSGNRVYGTSKLANILFTRELARRAAGSDVTATCYHPGIVASDFGRDTVVVRAFYQAARGLMRGVDKGAETGVWLASAPAGEWTSGVYYSDRSPGRTSKAARDETLARDLWERSAQMVGVPA